MISHNNQTGRWISSFRYAACSSNVMSLHYENWMEMKFNLTLLFFLFDFRAIWGWDDSSIFIGNMKRGVDVISPAHSKIVMTLQSPEVSAIPCRFHAHPYQLGTLAGATSGGQIYTWTLS